MYSMRRITICLIIFVVIALMGAAAMLICPVYADADINITVSGDDQEKMSGLDIYVDRKNQGHMLTPGESVPFLSLMENYEGYNQGRAVETRVLIEKKDGSDVSFDDIQAIEINGVVTKVFDPDPEFTAYEFDKAEMDQIGCGDPNVDEKYSLSLKPMTAYNAGGRFAYGLFFEFHGARFSKDLDIKIYFSDYSPIYTPNVVIDGPDDADLKTHFIRNAPDNSYSLWQFTSVSDTDIAFFGVTSPDGTYMDTELKQYIVATPYIKVKSSGEQYTAHFGEVVPEIIKVQRSKYPLGGTAIAEHQRVQFDVAFVLKGALESSVIDFDIYSGDPADKRHLGYTKFENEGYDSPDSSSLTPQPMGRGHYTAEVNIPDMPKNVSELTIVASVDGNSENEKQSYSFTIDPVVDSDVLNLKYLNIPGSLGSSFVGGYYSCGDNGPGAYDAASYIDERTGALHTYIATTSGIVMIDENGEYTQMEGAKNTTFLAVGGEDEDSLYAISIDHGDRGHYDALYIYEYKNDQWKKVEGSILQKEKSMVDFCSSSWPLILSGNDIWTEDKHWNGAEWLENEYEFSTFWNNEKGAVYAGAADGVYYYRNTEWKKIYGSDSKVILSGTEDSSIVKLLLYHPKSSYWNVIGEYSHLYDILGGAQDFYNGSLSILTIDGNNYTEKVIDFSEVPDTNGSIGYEDICGATFDKNGDLLVMAGTFPSHENQFGGYSSAALYKLTDDGWVYQHVPEFNSQADLEQYDAGEYHSKVRPDGITYAKNTVPGVTLYLGGAGAIYADYGETTITFDSEGGSDVSPITKKIRSSITQPSSPTKAGSTFAGWYTDLNDLSSQYTFNKMPAKNITLHARWVEPGSQEEEEYIRKFREQALDTLDDSYGRLKRSTYSDANWQLIQEIYARGKNNINTAANTEKAIMEALNNAVEDMLAVEHLSTGNIKVCITMELFTLNEGYIVKPTIVNANQYELVSVLITDELKKTFPDIAQPWKMTGSVKRSFYLSHAYSEQEGWVGEFDHGLQSGWMYAVNHYFPSVGASSWSVEDGDVIRWQYTVTGYGLDLGTSEEWATPDGQPATVANKDALTWLVAEVNGKIDSNAEYLTKYELQEEYDSAMTALTTMYSTQATVNDAYDTLNAAFLEAKKKENEEQGQGGGGTLPDTDDVQELKAALSELIASAKEVSNEEGKYTEESFALMQEKIAAAEAVAADESAVADTVRTAFTDLSEAWKGLKISPEYEEKINKLKADIAAAVKDAEAISNADGKYTAESYKVLMDAINTARLIIADDNATTAQLEFALDAVAKAKAGLVEAPAPDEPPTPDEPSEPEVKPKKKAVVVNVKTVSAAVLKKAMKKANNKGVTKVTLGKKVRKIKKGAFKGTKVRTVVVKTKKLKKASVKGCFKGSKVKTVQVKVGSRKVNKTYVKKYKKVFTKKICGKKIKVK